MFPFRWFRSRSTRPIRRVKPARVPLGVETLEARLTPAAVWTGGGGAGNTGWSVTANWAGGNVPSNANTTVTFPTAGVTNKVANNDIAGLSNLNINFAGTGGYTVSGTGFGTTGISDASTAGTNTISASVTLNNNQAFSTTNAGHMNFTGMLVIGNNALTLAGPGEVDLAAVNLGGNNAIIDSQIATARLTGVISGTAGTALSVAGSATSAATGTVFLSGANTFTGAVVVGASNGGSGGLGTLVVSNSSAFGASNPCTISNGATLDLRNGINLPSGMPINFSAGGTLRKGDASSIDLGSVLSVTGGSSFTIAGPSGGVLSIDRAITPGNNVALSVTGTNFTLELQNAVGNSQSGFGDVTVGTGATLNLNFGMNQLAIPQNLTINSGGTVLLKGSNQILASSQVVDNGTLNLNGFSNTISQITGSGSVVLGAGALTINYNGGMANTFNGTFTSTFNGTLNKAGTGTLILTGGSSGFVGSNNVQGGIEALAGGTLGGVTNVADGTSFGGAGTAGIINVTANNSATVNPGPFGTNTGTLNSGNVGLDGATTYNVTVTSGAADLLNSTGTVNLANATLNLQVAPNFSAPVGTIFTIIQTTGTLTAGTTFAGLPNGAMVTDGPGTFTINYNYAAKTVTLKVASLPTNTSLQVQPTSAVFQQTVTFTVNVVTQQGGNPATTGIVTIKDGSTVLGTGNVNNSGQAIIQLNNIAVGSYKSLVAYFHDASAKFADSNSGNNPQMLVVDRANTTVGLAQGQNPITFGNPGSVTGTVQVTAPGSGSPIGPSATSTVTFTISGGRLSQSTTQTVKLSGVNATLNLSTFLPSSNPYTITAVYNGDTNFAPSSTSNSVQITINPAVTQGSITSIQPNPKDLGENSTYAFQLTVPLAAGQTVTPGGTVTFTATKGGTSIQLGPSQPLTKVSDAVYTAMVSSTGGVNMTAGTWTITAAYSGDGNYQGTSAVGSQVVNPGVGTLQMSFTSPVALGFGATASPQSVYTVKLTGPVAPSGTGTMTIKDTTTNTTLGSTTTFSGSGPFVFTVSYQGTDLTVGDHVITATYSGDNSYQPNPTDTGTQTVTRGGVFVTMTQGVDNTPNPSSLGQAVTFTAHITTTIGAGIMAKPGGSVIFIAVNNQTSQQFVFAGGAISGAAGGNAYTSTGIISSLPPGTYNVRAVYTGDGNYFGNDSFNITQTVNKANSTTAIASINSNPSEYLAPVQFVVRVTVPAAGPAPDPTTGMVSVSTNLGVFLGASRQFVSAGGGNYDFTIDSTTVLNPGRFPVIATYSGDQNNYNGSTSPSVVLTVQKTVGPQVAISAPSDTLIGSGPVSYTVTYTDPFLVTGSINLTHNDVLLNLTGTVEAEYSISSGPAANQQTVTIFNVTGKGTLSINIAGGTAVDSFGNPAQAAGPSQPVTVDGFVELHVAFVNPPQVINRGATTVFNIQGFNLGNQLDRGVYLTAAVPAFSTFNPGASTPGWFQVTATVWRIDLGTLLPGQFANVAFAVDTAVDAPPNTQVGMSSAIFDQTSTNPFDVAVLTLFVVPRYPRWPLF